MFFAGCAVSGKARKCSNKKCRANANAKTGKGIKASTARIEIEGRIREGNGKTCRPKFTLEAVCCMPDCLGRHASFRKAKPSGVRTIYVEPGDSSNPALAALKSWGKVELVELPSVEGNVDVPCADGDVDGVKGEAGAGATEEDEAPNSPVVATVPFKCLKNKNRISVLEASPSSGKDKWYVGTVVELNGSRDSVWVNFDGWPGRWVESDEQWKFLSAM